MRIARFTTGEDPAYGLVDGAGEKIAEITGDPLYQRIELTGAVHEVDDVRLLAPVIPRSKVVGVGSVGTRTWVVLLADATGAPLVLQLKEAGPSALAPYLVASLSHRAGGGPTQAERVVAGQRLLQGGSDPFLGSTRARGVDGVTRAYQWTRDGAPIAGATGDRYRLVAADAGRSIAVTVTATAEGSTEASASSSAVTVDKLS